jgi:hypothetical protein
MSYLYMRECTNKLSKSELWRNKWSQSASVHELYRSHSKGNSSCTTYVMQETGGNTQSVDTRVSVTLDSLLCTCVLMCFLVWLCQVLCLSPLVPSAMWRSSCDSSI